VADNTKRGGREASRRQRARSETALPPRASDNGEAPRCGFIALIGAPNVGKSTLVNALVGSKVSIVTHKVQTTRALVRGIAIVGSAQLVFVDTPGIFAPRRRLDRAMVATAWGGAHDAAIVALLIDAKRGSDDEAQAIIGRLAEVRQPKVLIINKIDLVARPSLLALAAQLNAQTQFAATFMLSALTGDGVSDLRCWFAARVPLGPWLYPADEVSDAPLRSVAAEITREKLYLRLHEELPYHATVETDQWKQLKDGSVRIEQTIYVERESQRKIVLGKGGRTVKAIGADARREIAAVIEAPVHLFLFVKVREGWGDDPERYRNLGLEFPKQ
jgi:GTP-binding protein Era